jgi:hypothetical protein
MDRASTLRARCITKKTRFSRGGVTGKFYFYSEQR